MNESAN